MPQQAHIFKNPDQGFLENMVSVHTLTLLAILRIVRGEGADSSLCRCRRQRLKKVGMKR